MSPPDFNVNNAREIRTFYITKFTLQPAQKNQSQGDFFEAQVQRKCEKCEDKEEEKVQKKSSEQTTSVNKNFFGHYMNQIDSKGSGISKSNRTFFESRLNSTVWIITTFC